MEIKGLEKIYIIHYVKLVERRAYLERRLRELGLEDYAEWVISTKDGSFPKKELAMQDSSEQAMAERKKYLGEKIPPIGRIDMIMMLQHIQVLRKIASNKKENVSMVFEDDVLLDDDFPDKLRESVDKLRNIEWDICYTDKGSLLVEPNVRKEKNSLLTLYESRDKRANTTGSFLIKSAGAKLLLKLMKKITLGPDMELTYVQKKNNLNVYWTVPFLTHQGSIEEVYQSNVRRGSIAGRVIKITKKIEKFSPALAMLISRSANFTMKLANNSRFFSVLKNKVKRLMKLQ